MILKQGFHAHPKTVMLRKRGGSAAVEALQQLWLFAENARTWQFPNWTREFVAAIGSIYGQPDFADLLTQTGFLDVLPDGGFALHDFADHNAALIQRWENGRFGKLGAEFGKRGGRPGTPRETPGGGSGKPPVGGPKTPPTRPDQTREKALSPASACVRVREGPWPTLQECLRTAEMRAIPSECAEKWWLEHDARGGLDKTGQPLDRWESSLLAYAKTWRANEEKEKQRHANPNSRPGVARPDRNAGTANADVVGQYANAPGVIKA